MKKARQRKISYDLAYMWNKKKIYKWTYVRNKNRSTNIENKKTVTIGEMVKKDKLGVWD